MARSYTADEIGMMRSRIRLYARATPLQAEAMMGTYMTAGVDPRELVDSLRDKWAEKVKRELQIL